MSQPATIALAALLGAFTWSFLEYCIHRWAGHDRRFRKNIFAKEHIRHHSQGDYFAPAYKKGAAFLLALAVVSPPAIAIAGIGPGIAYALGLAGFYLYYEALHRLEHVHAGVGPYGRWARRHHFHHHFVDPSVNHGVTSPIWDLVFGTYRKPSVIEVPEKLAMRWLTDPASGDVRPELRESYALRSRGSRKKRSPAAVA
jgi:sterol desaturase/sphingolipid hydroxylase (fatty acid hydroxylase superfamily)